MSYNLKLFTPLNYLKIKNKALIVHTWLAPLVLAIILFIFNTLVQLDVNVIGTDGVVRSMNQLLSILVAFYIASLAAISTFSSSVLDKKISGEPAKLKTIVNRQPIETELTRRRFLSLLFAYCAFLSLVLFVLGELAIVIGTNLDKNSLSSVELLCFIKFMKFLYTFAIFNLLTTTLLGLHYLADRIHRD